MKLSNLIIAVAATAMSVSAMAADSSFNTPAQASKYCPSVHALQFTPLNKTPNGAGLINATGPAGAFHNYSFNGQRSVGHPAQLNGANMTGVTVRSVGTGTDTSYGHISGDAVVCLYSYETTYGADYALALLHRG